MQQPVLTRRLLIRLIVVVVAIGLPIYLLTSTVLSAWVFGMGAGNVKYATTWRDRFERFDDPESAQAAYSAVEAKRFPNGEWVFGVSSDSHGSHWGGTIVVRDSTGKIHAYFGHVCGPRRLEHSTFGNSNSLKEFYESREWSQFKFQEYDFSR